MTTIRPSTPNMVLYDNDNEAPLDDGPPLMTSRPGTASTLAPPAPVVYQSPPDSAMDSHSVGKGIWTIEGENDALDEMEDEEEETKILLDKEFDDHYEDSVHKSAGPVVFVSKTLGMLPAIWTEEESENECKSYFNLYTFAIFIGWVGLAVVTYLEVDDLGTFPGDTKGGIPSTNTTFYHLRYVTRAAMDTYLSCTWISSIIALLFGVFKCRSFAEVLFGLSETDAQLELKEKHYEKIKRKSLYWIVFLLGLLVAQGLAFYTFLNDSDKFNFMLFIAVMMAHGTLYVLDLQFLHFSMVICKRYRMVNKILVHITKPWKTFRNEAPSQYVLQSLIQYRFDQIFEPSGDTTDLIKQDIFKKDVPVTELIKDMGNSEPKISKEEENTFILQLDIVRGIHADLNSLAHEVNHLLGFQVLVHVITSVIYVVMFGYFFAGAMFDDKFYWPYLVLTILPAVRLFLIGHWGQLLEQQSRLPFMTICQVSTVDGSPRLERQVQKLTIQMHHQCPTLTAAGYFNLGRNMILKTVGCAVVFTFFMVKFQQYNDNMMKMTMPMPAPPSG